LVPPLLAEVQLCSVMFFNQSEEHQELGPQELVGKSSPVIWMPLWQIWHQTWISELQKTRPW